MPEYPDIEVYCSALRSRLVGQELQKFRVFVVYLLKTADPSAESLIGQRIADVTRLGKRVVLQFENGTSVVIHLMVAGRFQWKDGQAEGVRPGGRQTLALWQFSSGALTLSEAGSKHRASVHLTRRLWELDPGGLDVFACSKEAFHAVLRQENRTLKRALTNPRWFSGIGNSYSDEILFHARLSPVRLTQSLNEEEVERLFDSLRGTLTQWRERLEAELGGKFPGKGQVTAFRPDFAVHGKFGHPCPVCKARVQRIVYAENETNYCAKCQNNGRVLADRALSRLLKGDWPRTLDED